MSDVASGVFLNSESVVVVSGIEGLLETVRGIHSFALRNTSTYRWQMAWLYLGIMFSSNLFSSLQVYRYDY